MDAGFSSRTHSVMLFVAVVDNIAVEAQAIGAEGRCCSVMYPVT